MHQHRLVLAFGLLGALALLPACGGGDTNKDDSGSSNGGGADVGAVDSGSDSGSSSSGGGADTGLSSSSSSGGGSSSGSSGAGEDIAVVKTACDDTLRCRLACAANDTDCLSGCLDAAEDQAKSDVEAVEKCAVDLCKEVTEGNAAEVACAFDKCGDKLSTCMGYGTGTADCVRTAQCMAKCTLGDLGCALECMVQADSGSVTRATAVKTCIDAHCLGAPPAQQEQCILDHCAEPIAACTDGKPLSCKDLNQCEAHCPDSLAIAKNLCVPACHGMASAKGRKQGAEYAKCKEQCPALENQSACWAAKCPTEQQACYGTGGPKSCQEINNCVFKECESIGGDQDCVEKCLATGKPWAQDAFVHYEGCILKNLKTKEAKTAKCSFPYDQVTCINVIKRIFCGNEGNNCFTSQ